MSNLAHVFSLFYLSFYLQFYSIYVDFICCILSFSSLNGVCVCALLLRQLLLPFLLHTPLNVLYKCMDTECLDTVPIKKDNYGKCGQIIEHRVNV